MKYVIVLSLLILGCANQQVKKEMDSRNYSTQDLAEIRTHAEKFNKMLSVGSTSLMFSSPTANTSEQAKTIQKYFCKCTKDLGTNCIKNSEGVPSDKKELWAKGNAAELSLKSLGYSHLVDKDLCD